MVSAWSGGTVSGACGCTNSQHPRDGGGESRCGVRALPPTAHLTFLWLGHAHPVAQGTVEDIRALEVAEVA